MEFRVLGPLEVAEQGRLVPIGYGQERTLLAILVLHANEVVSSDRLIEELWQGRPPATANKIVQVGISRLRKRVGHEGRLVTQGAGYVLRVDAGELDADEFERLSDAGMAQLDGGQPTEAAETLREALALWRGPALADLLNETFAQREAARLEERRLAALETRIDADLELGRHGELVSELEALVTENPLHERFTGQLMLALYARGRQAEALEAYRRTRDRLSEELGLEPGPALRELQAAILKQDPDLALQRTKRRSPPKAAPTVQRGEPPAPAGRLGRRWVLMAGAGAVLLVGAAAVLLLTGGGDEVRTAPANSVGIIDADSGTLVGDVSVGAAPGDIASSTGALWVANLDDNSVARIDPRRRAVVRTVSAGQDLKGLAARGDQVWAVAGAYAERIDPGFNSIARRVRLQHVRGLAPEGAIAIDRNAILVSTGSAQVTRLATESGRLLGGAVDVGNAPRAIAADNVAVWVADHQDGTVTRIDPTGVVAVIPVGHGPSDVAVGLGGTWVTNTGDGTVTRIDPDGRVRTTIRVGDAPRGIAVGHGAVWVADSGSGTVSRIDPDSNRVTARIAVGESPQDVTVTGGRVWVTLRASPPATQVTAGGTLRVVAPRDPGPLDPAALGASLDAPALYQELAPTCAKLLDYPDRPAPEGTRLQPEVARAMPTVSRRGRRYTFALRQDFRFAPPSNQRVDAAAFERTIERALDPASKAFATTLMTDIVGASAFARGQARRIAGVHAQGDRLTVDLVAPAPDLPARLATPYFCAVPPDTPTSGRGIDAPAAGPYYVTSHVRDQSLVLRRNPHYRGTRPHRLDRIAYRFGVSPQRAAADVAKGDADYATAPPIAAHQRLDARFGPDSGAARAGRQRYFVNPTITLWYLVMNTRREPFADARMRRAVNFALDRDALAEKPGPESTGRPTDQYLPPGMPGFRDVAVYPLGAPDLREARRLARGRGARVVLYTCDVSPCPENAQLIRTQLGRIGLDVAVRRFAYPTLFQRLANPDEPYDLAYLEWLIDYVDPSNFINLLFGPGSLSDAPASGPASANFGGFRDGDFYGRMARASRLEGEERLRAYGALDADLAGRAAPAAAFATDTRRDLFSARVGCQVYQPIYGMDLAALCLRKPR